jgi:lysophospholipase L1-like esterase
MEGGFEVRIVILLGAVITAVSAHQLLGESPANADPPLDAKPANVAIIGDSYTGGSPLGGVGPAGWPELARDRLYKQGLLVVPTVTGLGGAGYVTVGTDGETLGQAVPRTVTPADKVVLFFAGMNDGTVPTDQVQAAAGAAFQSAHQIAPAARMLVIGPAWPNDQRDTPQVHRLRDAIKNAALSVGADFVDPIAEAWFATTPPGDIGADGVHPTDAGHVYLADQIEPHIRVELANAGVK